MEYDGVNKVVCEAEECSWLDVSYSDKYIDDKNETAKDKPRKHKFGKVAKIVTIAVLFVGVLCGLLLSDSGFKGDVFQSAKATYLSVLDVFGNKDQEVNTIELPRNIELIEVNNGVATLGGGKLLLSFTKGKVSEITETSVTVDVDTNTKIVYNNLSDIFAKLGDNVDSGSLIARYGETVTASILCKNEIVQNVFGTNSELKWSI